MTEQQISRTQAWLESLRPKTLPLAFAAIIVGTALAWWQGHFDPLVALLALITAGLLQILSNLANDYGDAVKGSDKPDRIGPLRGMQKGVITQQEMKRALIITVVLICLSGLALVAVACHTLADFVGFLILGGLSIIAAITYTVGNRPYGYINSDRENGKNTLVVRLGEVNARRYHACLLMGSLVCLALFNLFSLHSLWGWLFLLAAPLLVKQARYVMREMDPVAMRPMLERTVKGALLTNLLFVLGIFLSQWTA